MGVSGWEVSPPDENVFSKMMLWNSHENYNQIVHIKDSFQIFPSSDFILLFISSICFISN